MKNDPFRASFDSLEEFADMVSEVLHCPITIEDANHRLLAYSTHDDRTDPARIATIIGRRVPEKVINSLWKEGVIPSLLNSREPVRVKTVDEIGLGNRVAVSIWKNDEVLGFIWALEIEKTLGDEEMDCLKRAADATKNKLIQLQNRKNKKEEQYQEFFWQLLTSHLSSNEEIINKFHALQISPPTLFGVAVFQFSKELGREDEKQIAYLLKTIQLPKILLHTIDHQQLILFIALGGNQQPVNKLNAFCELFVVKMKERFGIESIVQGYSSVYCDLGKVEKAYKEARTVLSVKRKFPSEAKEIHGYQSLGIYKYIDVLIEKASTDQNENYSLKRLQEYDKKNNTDLVETLEVFLNKDSNVHEAANALNVHTNTLNYRLKRISEIGEINLKDPNQKISLYLDLKLEKFKK
ncbi:PucR family transcriptional regulator [Neobacillus sp. 179-J 1A1 HS]|uniref:PucR family transcriptional regulator n=1 Tax=Neobacillus driksii TaxID=3035913 RepID=UPI0035BBAA67